MTSKDFCSSSYWNNRYRDGGNSGPGSYGRLAEYKGAFLGEFFSMNNVQTVLELGCGDGNQLKFFRNIEYVGYDVSENSIERCREICADKPGYRIVDHLDDIQENSFDATLSLDVVFHLIEDKVFENHIDDLFFYSKKYVIIYSSNFDGFWPSEHVLHRKFTKYITKKFPEWRLAAKVKNLFPFRSDDTFNTSFSDFYVFCKLEDGCIINC